LKYSIEYPKINPQTISPAGGKVERIVPDPLVRNFEGIISYGLWDLRTGDRDRLLLVRKGRSDRPWSALTQTHSTNPILKEYPKPYNPFSVRHLLIFFEMTTEIPKKIKNLL